jgi:RNA polymerase sigma factor (sigma-70 family)
LDVDVRAAATGDRDAFGRLVDATRALVTSIALAVVRDVPVSEDVAQEVYLAAWRDLPRLRQPGSFLPWLRQLTRNRAHDQVRARRPMVDASGGHDLVDPQPDAAQQLEAAEQQAAVAAAFEALPDDAREVVTLFYREGRSIAQVAALLEMREEAIRKRLQRARQALRAATLERLGQALERSAPGAAFTLAVVGALGIVAPATASAAIIARAAGTKAGGKLAVGLGAGLGGATLGALLGVFGAGYAIRQRLRAARDDEERAGLRRIGVVNGVAIPVCALAMALLDRVLPSLGPAIAFAVLVAIVGFNYIVWLPRVIGRRLALERAQDPGAARRQRRERIRGAFGLVFGVFVGGGALAFSIWRRLHGG